MLCGATTRPPMTGQRLGANRTKPACSLAHGQGSREGHGSGRALCIDVEPCSTRQRGHQAFALACLALCRIAGALLEKGPRQPRAQPRAFARLGHSAGRARGGDTVSELCAARGSGPPPRGGVMPTDANCCRQLSRLSMLIRLRSPSLPRVAIIPCAQIQQPL